MRLRGFCLLQIIGIWPCPCAISPGKKRTLGLPIRLQTYCAPGGLAGDRHIRATVGEGKSQWLPMMADCDRLGQPLRRGAGRIVFSRPQEGEAAAKKGGQAMRLGGGGRKDGAGGGGVLPALRAGKTNAGAGAEGPSPCFVRAVRARRPGRGWEKPGPALNGPGRRKTWAGRGGAGRDTLGKAAAHDLWAAAA